MYRKMTLLFMFFLFFNASCSDENSTDNSQANGERDFLEDQSENRDLLGDKTDQSESVDQSDPIPECIWTSIDIRGDVYHGGTFANALVIRDGQAWIVNSGDNTIQKVDLESMESEDHWIDVGENQNPYAMAFWEDRIYISNLMGNSISVAKTTDGSIVGTTAHDSLLSPQGIAVTKDYIFVANTEFVYGSESTSYGSLVIFSREDQPQYLNRIATTQPNPQFVEVYGDKVYVINSGRLDFDPETYVSTPVGPSGVDIFEIQGIEQATSPWQNIGLGEAQGLIGNPGKPAFIEDQLYLGSGTAGVLFQIDIVEGKVVRGIENPIELGIDLNANAMIRPFVGPDAKLYILDFNHDALLRWDPQNQALDGEPINTGVSDSMLEGPLDLAWHGCQGHILHSISSGVSTFNF